MSREMKKEIMERLHAEPGHVGFYYKNLVTGEEFGFHEEEEFSSASIIKFPILLQILKWAEEGKADLTERIQILQEEKMPLSGVLTLFSGEPEIDVETLCRLMISVSDNTAANVLMKRYGVEALEQGFAEMGLKKTHLRRLFFDKSGMGQGLRNVFSPAEAGMLLEQLYREEFASGRVCRQAMDILKQQQINHKIGGFLGEHVPIAHKTGEDDDISNDVGIVFALQPFVICFAGEGINVPSYEILMREICYGLYLEANRG